jgi:hypothetical protein
MNKAKQEPHSVHSNSTRRRQLPARHWEGCVQQTGVACWISATAALPFADFARIRYCTQEHRLLN